MGQLPLSLEPQELIESLASVRRPMIFDVRKHPAYLESDIVIATASWRDPQTVHHWQEGFRTQDDVVVYCIHGHQMSQSVAALLREAGLAAHYLIGGIDGYVEAGGPTVARESLPERGPDGRSRWVTRARPKIDQIACPWLVRRFIDADAAFLYVETDWVHAVGDVTGATPFDLEGAELTLQDGRCSFDAFIDRFDIHDAALDALADIVRGVDTGNPIYLRKAPVSSRYLGVSRFFIPTTSTCWMLAWACMTLCTTTAVTA